MKRDFPGLSDGPFDLLVVGGGIYGAWTACDASLRGLRVALVERGDWASGTSSASSKLIHGGLRYLEQGRFSLVRRTLRERALLSALAPHLVRPSRFVVPLYSGGRTGPFLLKAGLALYDFISRGDRPGGERLTLGAGEALSSYPFLQPRGLKGALSYGDAVTDDARFTLEVVEAAMAAGAGAVNYAEALEPVIRKGCAGGAVIRDRIGGATIEVEASAVVNTAGPWVTGMKGCRSLADKVRFSKGVHLVFPALPAKDAFLFLTRQDRRILFLIPWYGRTLVGTTDTDFDGSPDEVRVEPEDRAYIFEELRHALRPGTWDEKSVLGSSAGLRILVDRPGTPSHALTREWVLREPKRGLLVSIGGKFTSARADAARIVDRVMASLGRSRRGSSPTEAAPWARSPGKIDGWLESAAAAGKGLGLSWESACWLARRYGTAVDAVHGLLGEDPSLAVPLAEGLPFCRAEVVFAVRREMAFRLTDILRRRIPLMLLTAPGSAIVAEVSSLAAPLLGWTQEQIRAEEGHAMGVWEGSPEGTEALP